MERSFEIAVIGGGLSGATAALALGREGLRTALVAPRQTIQDGRTTALMMPSIGFLDRMGVWKDIAAFSAPLRTMRIIDATSRLFRPAPVTFEAREVGEDAFGYNIPNAPLLDTITAALETESRVCRFNEAAVSAVISAEDVTIELDDGTRIRAEFVAGADGRNSLIRDAATISARRWTYPQTALVFNFEHMLDHFDTSNEFHTESGPLTQVPLPGKRSSLVWALANHDAERLSNSPATELAEALERRMQSMFGKLKIVSKVHQFPFSGLIAERFSAGRAFLIGEAGHLFPPIGAQGFNLGLRDIMDLVDAMMSLKRSGNIDEATRRYNAKRGIDVRSRTFGVDLLNRSLLTGFLPVQMARYAGLASLGRIAPLRQILMREGMDPGSGLRSFEDLRQGRM